MPKCNLNLSIIKNINLININYKKIKYNIFFNFKMSYKNFKVLIFYIVIITHLKNKISIKAYAIP